MVAATSVPHPADAAFERLFLEEYAKVVSVAYRITGDRAEAEDVAQDVFARLARKRALSGARGLLYRAAVHGALNAVRGRKRRARREQSEFRLQRSLRDAGELAADPARIVNRGDDAARVHDALLRIAARDAEILALRYGGLSYREIAQAAGIDVRQVGVRLARAERAFRKEFERGTSR